MDHNQQADAKFIRGLESREAAIWVLQKYPPKKLKGVSHHFPYVIFHRSWAKPEQKLLFSEYLVEKVYGSPSVYEGFIKITSMRFFRREIQKIRQIHADKLELLDYNLSIAIRKFCSRANHEEADQLIYQCLS